MFRWLRTVDYKNDTDEELELHSHFIGGIMLVTDLPPGVLEPTLTKTPGGIGSQLAITSIRTMQQQVELSLRSGARRRRTCRSFRDRIAGAGVDRTVCRHGLRGSATNQARSAFAWRWAPTVRMVTRLVLRDALNRVLAGLMLGLPLAVGAGRLIAAQLYGASSWDPLALSVAAGALVICCFFAAVIPAIRAASISPLNALRTDQRARGA